MLTAAMFDHAQLKSFATLARVRHFGRAAHELFITQPALSRRIQQLEADVGGTLFQRDDRRVELTPAGHAFVPEVERLLEQMEVARQAVRKASGALAGSISVGFDGAATYALIPKLVDKTRSLWPDVSIRFTELNSREQMREVAFHRLDVGLVRPLPHEDELSMSCVFGEPLALVMPAGHRLSGKRRPTIRDLDGEAFVAYSQDGLYLRDLIAGLFDDTGVTPHIIQSMSRTHSILALVSTGMGVAIVPAGSANAAFDNLLFKPLAIPQRAEWHAIRHRRPMNDLARPLIELMGMMEG